MMMDPHMTGMVQRRGVLGVVVDLLVVPSLIQLLAKANCLTLYFQIPCSLLAGCRSDGKILMGSLGFLIHAPSQRGISIKATHSKLHHLYADNPTVLIIHCCPYSEAYWRVHHHHHHGVCHIINSTEHRGG